MGQELGKNGHGDIQEVVEATKQGMSQTVADATAQVSQSATTGELTRTLRESAYRVKDAASSSLLKAAEAIRREAAKTGNPEATQRAQDISRRMEKAALYLDSHTFEQMAGEVDQSVEENPRQALFIAFIVGLFLGMLMRRRR